MTGKEIELLIMFEGVCITIMILFMWYLINIKFKEEEE